MRCRSKLRRRVAALVLGLCAVITVLTLDAAAQAPTGSIGGVAADDTGAAVADVRVTVTNDASALRREVVTGPEGTFTLPLLPPGRYTLRAERDGFAARDIIGIVVSANEQVTVRVRLLVDAISEEVVVTARKREERLQDVPGSIAAASAEALQNRNIVGVTELDAFAPGLTFATNPGRFGSGPSIALRGISTQTQSAGIQDSVSIVIDGVPIARAKAGAFPDLHDTERIEVMRGPQGTLFGKNASAGVISVTTKDPADVLESDVTLGYGTYDTRTVRASVTGPFAGRRARGRASFYNTSRDGFVENIFDGSRWEADEQTGFRGKLLLTAGANDTLKIGGDFLEQNNDAGTQLPRAFLPLTLTPQYVRDSLASIAGPKNDKINTHSLGDNRHRSGGVQLQWDRALGHHTLTALGAYRTFSQRFHQGTYAWLTPLDEGDITGDTGLEQYSAEIRVASSTGRRVEYVAGAFFFDNRVDTALRDPDPGLLVVGTSNRTQRNYLNVVQSLNAAAFAEANVAVADALTVTAGLRFTHETVDVDIIGFPISDSARRAAVPLGTTTDSASADDVSWKLGGQWRFASDRMLYVSATSGFKGPGFNVNITSHGDAQPVRPETSSSVEAGVKAQFLGRRLTTNLSAFHSVFTDFQTQAGLIVAGNPNATVRLLNAGKLRTRGFETELAAALTRTTEVSVNATLIDGIFQEFKNAPCYPGQAQTTATCVGNAQDLSGSRLPNTPKWALNLFGRQDFTVPGPAPRGFATVDYSWHDSVQWDSLGSPLGIEPGYGLLGASVGLRTASDRLSVKVYGKNLTDQFHTSGIAVGTAVTHFLPVTYRRTFGIELSVFFRKPRSTP